MLTNKIQRILFSIINHITDSIETNISKNPITKFNYEMQYHNLESANINDEVDYAIQIGDYRIIALRGASYVFPGLSGGYKIEDDGSKVFIGLSSLYESHFKKFGFKVIKVIKGIKGIKGTSDSINPDDLPLQAIAYDFASNYNVLLFEKIKEIKIKKGD